MVDGDDDDEWPTDPAKKLEKMGSVSLCVSLPNAWAFNQQLPDPRYTHLLTLWNSYFRFRRKIGTENGCYPLPHPIFPYVSSNFFVGLEKNLVNSLKMERCIQHLTYAGLCVSSSQCLSFSFQKKIWMDLDNAFQDRWWMCSFIIL